MLLDHIADYLQFISNAQSFWFELNTSMTMATTSSVDSVWTHKTQGCVASRRTALVLSCHASWLSHCLLSSSHCVILSSYCRTSWLLHPLHCPLVVLLRQLVVALPLTVLSLFHPLIVLSHQLVVVLSLLVVSLRPAPPSRPHVAPAGCCVASRCAALSSSCCLVVQPLVASLCQLVVALSSLFVLLLHCPLVLSSCWLVVVLPVLAPPSCPLVVVHRPHHRTPSNAAAAIKHHHRHHGTPSIVHRCHSCCQWPP